MHRNLKVALGGAALSVGVVVGLPAVALADPVDCTDAEIAALYPEACIPKPSEMVDAVTPPAAPSQPVVGGNTGGGTAGGGTAGGGTAGGSTAGGSTAGGSTAGGSTIGGGSVSSGRGAVESLPFTGDEVLVLGLAGAAALAIGTGLTVAGRRRGATTA